MRIPAEDLFVSTCLIRREMAHGPQGHFRGLHQGHYLGIDVLDIVIGISVNQFVEGIDTDGIGLRASND